MIFTAAPVSAHQWWKNGDHPEDDTDLITTDEGSSFLSEGKIVRRFRRPDVDGAEICTGCGASFDIHGWIDGADLIVHPGDWVVQEEARVYTVQRPQSDDLVVASYVADCRDCSQKRSFRDLVGRSDWVGGHRVKTGHVVDTYEVAK